MALEGAALLTLQRPLDADVTVLAVRTLASWIVESLQMRWLGSFSPPLLLFLSALATLARRPDRASLVDVSAGQRDLCESSALTTLDATNAIHLARPIEMPLGQLPTCSRTGATEVPGAP